MNSSLRCTGRHWQTGSYRKNDRGEIMSDGMIILIVIAVFVVLSLIATIANIKAKPPKPIEKGNLNRPSHYMYKTETTLDDKIAHLFIPEPLRVDPPPMVVDVAMDLVEQQEREELAEERRQKQITESILAQNKRDYRQDVKSGRIWICPKCRKKNEKYVTTCTCGTPKPVK